MQLLARFLNCCSFAIKILSSYSAIVENITNIGNHTLKLRTIVSDTSGASQLKSLPSMDIRFVVTEAGASKFTVGLLETPLRVGMPFQVSLRIPDFPADFAYRLNQLGRSLMCN